MKRNKSAVLLVALLGVVLIVAAVSSLVYTIQEDNRYELASVLNDEGIEPYKEDNSIPCEPDLSFTDLHVWCELQYPQLPTGCEVTCLSMVLQYFGYDVMSGAYLADNYLIYTEDNYVTGFDGSPYDTDGGGIYPPGLVATANKYLEAYGSYDAAYDITGATISTIMQYVSEDLPVIVWITSDYGDPIFNGYYIKYDDIKYYWYTNEHTVVISGYNITDNYLIIEDPLSGEQYVDAKEFESIYTKCGRLAMLII